MGLLIIEEHIPSVSGQTIVVVIGVRGEVVDCAVPVGTEDTKNDLVYLSIYMSCRSYTFCRSYNFDKIFAEVTTSMDDIVEVVTSAKILSKL